MKDCCIDATCDAVTRLMKRNEIVDAVMSTIPKDEYLHALVPTISNVTLRDIAWKQAFKLAVQ